jgi:hypothetical protein
LLRDGLWREVESECQKGWEDRGDEGSHETRVTTDRGKCQRSRYEWKGWDSGMCGGRTSGGGRRGTGVSRECLRRAFGRFSWIDGTDHGDNDENEQQGQQAEDDQLSAP